MYLASFLLTLFLINSTRAMDQSQMNLMQDSARSLHEQAASKGDTCVNLLTSGHLDELHKWRPDGCGMHQYSCTDAMTCIQNIADGGERTHIVFIGDSRIRNVYATFVHLLDPNEFVVKTIWDKLHDHKFVLEESRVLVQYILKPYVDDSLRRYFQMWRNENTPPSMIVTGNGLWSIKNFNASLRALQEYSGNLSLLAPVIDDLASKNSTVIWTLQEPVVYERLASRRKAVTNQQIDLYNDAAIKVLGKRYV